MSFNRQIEYQLHPLRETLYNELHIRPFPKVETPQLITHLVACCAERDLLKRAFDQLCDLCRRYGVNLPQDDTAFFQQDFGDFSIHWERHVEFYSLTIMTAVINDGEPFEHAAVDLLPADWLRALPGQMVGAFHLIIDDHRLDYSSAALTRCFEAQPLMAGNVANQRAQVYTAFKIHGDNHGRFVIRNQGLNTSQMGQLARRTMDLETYRLLALLSLPLAKRIAPQLLDMDRKLAEMLNRIKELESSRGERELLEKLTQVEARLETYRAETNHRFSATRAYHQMVKDRLEGIKEESIEGALSLGEFISRRLDPALRTCDSMQTWMEDLSKRIERASDLMRTRVNLNLQEQNRSQLTAMNRRSRLQFRLQETVEGLSIAAISYYAVGLLSYLFGGLPLKNWGIDKNVLLASSIPVVVIVIWYVTHRIKHRLIKDQDVCE
ncbi:MAG: DUF3422 domain-containing protein [Desulfuromonas sp.]|nr:MAG: DUF3422 domain-containing protein [Desulfuromonas sp.]